MSGQAPAAAFTNQACSLGSRGTNDWRQEQINFNKFPRQQKYFSEGVNYVLLYCVMRKTYNNKFVYNNVHQGEKEWRKLILADT